MHTENVNTILCAFTKMGKFTSVNVAQKLEHFRMLLANFLLTS